MSLHPAPVGPPPNRASRSLFGWALLTIPLWVGCADPDGKFDEFVERTEMNMPAKPDAGPPTPVGDGGQTLFSPEQIEGEYLSVTATPIPTLPVVYHLDVTAKVVGDGLELTFVDQPLAYWDRKTPVGPKSAPRAVMLGADGTYTEKLIGTVTPADANPITFMESTSDTTFVGDVGNAELNANSKVVFFCGTVDAHVYPPISTDYKGAFVFLRIEDSQNYPAVVVDCNKTPADPPPEKP